jgi:hypothetical protein
MTTMFKQLLLTAAFFTLALGAASPRATDAI